MAQRAKTKINVDKLKCFEAESVCPTSIESQIILDAKEFDSFLKWAEKNKARKFAEAPISQLKAANAPFAILTFSTVVNLQRRAVYHSIFITTKGRAGASVDAGSEGMTTDTFQSSVLWGWLCSVHESRVDSFITSMDYFSMTHR